ncbi:MAG TPA: hypothetical protein VG323_16875 [Thermoanaerobaculia bacterium]|nr:hypothetical protein [Thermoanaerobaculia bacterium]
MPRFVLIVAALLAATAAAAQTPPEPEPAPEPTAVVMVPVVGKVYGANSVQWRTDVDLINILGREVKVSLTLPTAPGDPFLVFSLPPGATQRIPDVVGAFSIDRALSPLKVTTFGSKTPIRVSATVYAVKLDDPTAPVHTEPIAVMVGDPFFPQRVLYGLSFSDDFRTNVGLANLGDAPALFTVALQRVSGRNIAVTQITVPPGTLWHTSIQALFPLITKGDDFSIIIETGYHETYVYASVIENATNEARFIEPSVAVPGNEPSAQE